MMQKHMEEEQANTTRYLFENFSKGSVVLGRELGDISLIMSIFHDPFISRRRFSGAPHFLA